MSVNTPKAMAQAPTLVVAALLVVAEGMVVATLVVVAAAVVVFVPAELTESNVLNCST